MSTHDPDINPATGLPHQAAAVSTEVASVTTQLEALVKQTPVPAGLNKGRIVTILGAVAGLAAALAPALANLDFASTGGVVGGVIAIALVVQKWLDGWQKYEQDVRDPTKFNEPAP